MTKTVVAIFNSEEQAYNAKNILLGDGFVTEQIDLSNGKNYAPATDAAESGISRFFKNLFGSNEDEHKRYTELAENGIIVTVHAHSDEEARRASLLLDEHGAVDVDSSYQQQLLQKDDYNDEYEVGQEPYTSIENRNNIIPVIEEDIKIGKREVITGGVRIKSRIVETPVEENLRLREEHIHVERNKVDRLATEEELRNFKNSTVELTEHAEVADIKKSSRVVEEVSLAREIDHRDETIRDNLRKTEVDVEDVAAEIQKPENRVL